MFCLLLVALFVNCLATVVINVKIEVPEDSPLLVAEAPLELPPSSGFEVLSSTVKVVFATVVQNHTDADNVTLPQITSTPAPTPSSSGEVKPFITTEIIYYSIGFGFLFFSVIFIYYWYHVKEKSIRTEPPKISVRITPQNNHQGFIRTSNKGFRVNSRKY